MTDGHESSGTSDPLDSPGAPEPAPEGGGGWSALGARGLAAALKPLAGLAGMAEDIKVMTGEVRRMANYTSTLPEVTETLSAIRARVDRLDQEVYEMHAAVEDMKVMLEPVAGQLESVSRLTNRLPGGRKHRRAQAEASDGAGVDEVDVRAHEAE